MLMVVVWFAIRFLVGYYHIIIIILGILIIRNNLIFYTRGGWGELCNINYISDYIISYY